MRALIYCRVSDDKAHGRSVREQEAESRELCKREGWTVAAVITDTVGASRHSKGKRSGWDQVAAEIEAGTVDVLVTWEASRASRDLSAYTALRDLCVRHGVQWSYGGSVYDLSDSRDRMRTAIDAIMAEDEADKISTRVLRAVRANVVAGRPHGRRLYGYKRIYDPNTGALSEQIPHPDEAPVVRRIFADYLAGAGVRTIQRALNREGVPTMSGKTWDYTQVRRILDNPGYAARRVHKGKVVGPADWPALIDPDQFDRVQARRQALYEPQRTSSAHLLTGVSRCGVCGGKVTTFVSHGRRSYMCREHHVARDQAKLDAYVSDLMVARLGQAVGAVEPASGDETTALRAQIAEREAHWDELADRAARGELSIKMLVRQEQAINAEIARLRAELRRLTVPHHLDLPPVGDVAGWWETLDPARRREYVNAFVDVVTIRRTQRGRRTFDPDAVEIIWR